MFIKNSLKISIASTNATTEYRINFTEVEKSSDDFTFKKVEDEDVYSNKTYYTFDSGSGNFQVVVSPSVADIDTYYEKVGEDVLSPFSLKFYLLQKAIALTNRLAYDSTFDLSTDNIDLDTLLEDTSHLVHNFEDIEPIGQGKYQKTLDTHVTYVNEVPSKIYYKYNLELHRYDPVPVTSMEYSVFNPSAMGLYVEEITYVIDKGCDTA